MNEIDLGLNIELSEEDKHTILSIYAETCPFLNIVEDIEMVMAGYKKQLSEETIKMFQKDEKLIQEMLNSLQEEEE